MNTTQKHMYFYIRLFLYSIASLAGIVLVALALLLLGSLLPRGYGYDIRIVEGGSMEPTIPRGAVVLTRAESSYEIGDVVTYQRRTDERATTHRLVETVTVEDESAFLTQGDANNVVDNDPVLEVEIAGRVLFHIPYVGYLFSFFRTPFGFLVLVLIPAVLIVRDQVIRIRRVVQKHKRNSIS